MKYSDKLRDPRWQKKRLEIMQRDDFKCKKCGDKDSTLNVHHRYYIWGKDPWDYPDEVLITVCSDCHDGEKEAMAEYMPLLTQQLSTMFFADQIFDIYCAFGMCNFSGKNAYLAEKICWALSDNDVCELVDKKFQEYLDTKPTMKNRLLRGGQ